MVVGVAKQWFNVFMVKFLRIESLSKSRKNFSWLMEPVVKTFGKVRVGRIIATVFKRAE